MDPTTLSGWPVVVVVVVVVCTGAPGSLVVVYVVWVLVSEQDWRKGQAQTITVSAIREIVGLFMIGSPSRALQFTTDSPLAIGSSPRTFFRSDSGKTISHLSFSAVKNFRPTQVSTRKATCQVARDHGFDNGRASNGNFRIATAVGSSLRRALWRPMNTAALFTPLRIGCASGYL